LNVSDVTLASGIEPSPLLPSVSRSSPAIYGDKVVVGTMNGALIIAVNR
jgi:hypothetical protein